MSRRAHSFSPHQDPKSFCWAYWSIPQLVLQEIEPHKGTSGRASSLVLEPSTPSLIPLMIADMRKVPAMRHGFIFARSQKPTSP